MNCHEARRWISPYLDSELGSTKTFEVSEHLQQCATCGTRFERERRVDAMLWGRLAPEPMPAELWNRIEDSILHPARPWWFRGAAPLALAACLALAILLPIKFLGTAPEAPGTWAINQFAQISPDGAPFADPGTGPINLAAATEELFDTKLGMEPTSPEERRHRVKLAQVRRHVDDTGAEFLEVRLNCCGEPVLLTVARRDRLGRLADIGAALADAPRLIRQQDDVNLGARQVGDLVVLAVSRHPVQPLLDSLHASQT